MSKNSCLRGPFEKQHGKRARARLKSASHGLYHIHRSLSSQSSQKKSLLLTCQILGLLVNTLAADEKYPVPNRDSLTIPIQMELSEKEKTFSQFSAAFLKYRLKFEFFLKKYYPQIFCTSEIEVSENPSTNNMINVPQHGSNLHHIVFIIFIDPCQVN